MIALLISAVLALFGMYVSRHNKALAKLFYVLAMLPVVLLVVMFVMMQLYGNP